MSAGPLEDPGTRTVTSLLEALAPCHGLEPAAVLRIWNLLASAAFPSDVRPSRILGDGTPFEIAVGMTPGGGGLRYLTELGAGTSRSERWRDARQRLRRLIGALALPEEPFLALLEPLLEEPPERVAAARAFGPWVAPVMSRAGDGLRLYLNATWWPEDRFWRALRRWLERLGWKAALEAMGALAEVSREGGEPYGLAMENTPRGPNRVKAYFRGAALSLRSVTRACEAVGVEAEPLAKLWRGLFPSSAFGAEEAVLSVALSGAGGVSGIKVDVESGVLGRDERELRHALIEAAGDQPCDLGAYRSTLAAGEAAGASLRHTVLAMASGRKGPRMSAYLAPLLGDGRSFARVLRAVMEP